MELALVQEWTWNGLIELASSRRLIEFGYEEEVRILSSRPLEVALFADRLEGRVPLAAARKIEALNIALAAVENGPLTADGARLSWDRLREVRPEVMQEVDALREIIEAHGLLTSASFIAGFGAILDRWGMRESVRLARADRKAGRFKDMRWPR